MDLGRLDPRKKENWKWAKTNWGFWALIVGAILVIAIVIFRKVKGV